MNIFYLWNKFIKKLPGSAIDNSTFEKPSKAEARSTVINSSFGKYSYCGYNCTIINCSIGRFSSIADGVSIGEYHHPIDWVSTSPAFYKGKDSIPKNLASLDYNYRSKETIIGNDVWIGKSAFIKDGVRIGDGAIVGMNAVVTSDLEPYGIYVGVPARLLRKRFSDEMIKELLAVEWWNLSEEILFEVSCFVNSPEAFIEKVKEKVG